MTSTPPNGRTSRFVRKVFIGLSFGAITYTLTNILLKEDDQLFTLGLSFFISGVVVVIEFLHDVERRMDAVESAQRDNAHTIEGRISEGINRINEATELFGLVEASAIRTDEVTQLVRNSTKIPAQPSLVSRFVQSEIGRMSRFLMEVGRGGDAVYEGEDRDWMLGLARNAEHTIDATSLTTVDAGGRGFVDGGLWSSDLGQRYLDIQRDRIENAGVTIRRLFIMDRPELLSDPDFRQVCLYHQELGVHIKVLDPSSIVGTPLSALFDFIIFDGVVSYEAQPASRIQPNSRPIIVSTRLVLQEERVRERIQRFEDLWRMAADFVK